MLAARAPADDAETIAPEGWSTEAPREEIRPVFVYLPQGGPNRGGSFVIEADDREGLFGWWKKTFDVEGGRTYRFFALWRTRNVELPRRAAVVRVLWRDPQGRPVLREKPTSASYRPGERPRAEPEFPADRKVGGQGWTEVSGVFHAPPEASRAIVELSYRWAPGGRAEWAAVSFAETPPPGARTARLATVHFRPREG
ncbi:MAG: carbon-nitrogen hydrolase family protein, partial [Planctomycetota bacterium]